MHSRLRLFLLAGVASMQVDLAQEPTVQQENARDLKAAYCVGVLTIDIRETQKRLQSKDADDNAREIWRSWIRN